MSQPAVVRYLRVRGARIRVSVRGEGRPILLVMGIGASLDMWGRFEKQLVQRGYRVIAYDLPGAGASPPVFPPRRMRGLAKLSVSLLDELGIDQVDVLGVSFGGVLAQEIAHVAPDRVQRLVLCATGPGLGGVPAHPKVLVHMATPLRYWNRSYAEWVAPRIYGGRARKEAALHGQMFERFDRPPSLYGYVGQLVAIGGYTSVPFLRRLTMPTLVLSGDDDPIVPLLNGRILAHLIPHADLHVFDGGGHLFLLDEPERSAALVHDFLAT